MAFLFFRCPPTRTDSFFFCRRSLEEEAYATGRSGHHGTIFGGYDNTVRGGAGTIGGGDYQTVEGNWSTAGGGEELRAFATGSTAVGGWDHRIDFDADGSTVLGGEDNSVWFVCDVVSSMHVHARTRDSPAF